MATYTTPRTPGTPRQAPGRGTPPPRQAAPPHQAAPQHQAAPPRQAAPPHQAAPPRQAAPPHRGAPHRAPRHTRPITGPATAPRAPRPAPGARTRLRRPRVPFILLLVGLLGGTLISLLVISTTLAEGSYRITGLQQQNASLARQEQLLTEQVAQAASPAQIAREAEELGMRPNPDLRFLNLKTGKVVSGHVSRADAEIDVPGYSP
jgi:hypothetical protein